MAHGLPEVKVDLDPVIHAEGRLRVVATLNALPRGDRLAFPKLQQVLGMTAGNLSTHNRKLEAAGYITITKVIEGRSPATYLELTDRGRLAFAAYRQQLTDLLGT